AIHGTTWRSSGSASLRSNSSRKFRTGRPLSRQILTEHSALTPSNRRLTHVHANRSCSCRGVLLRNASFRPEGKESRTARLPLLERTEEPARAGLRAGVASGTGTHSRTDAEDSRGR